MSFPRGHTPTLTFRAKEEIDLEHIAHIYVSLIQGGKPKIRKEDDEVVVKDNVISIFLSQEESLKFYAGDIEVEINWTYPDGRRGGNDTAHPIIVRVSKTHEGDVLP